MVNAIDVANVLAAEFPGCSILGQGDVMTFTGKDAAKCRKRAEELMYKAKLANNHLSLGHMRNKRNWWKRV